MLARIDAGYSKVDAAKAIGVAAPSYAGWEARRGSKAATRPTIEHLVSIAVLFGVSLEWLAIGAGPLNLGTNIRTMDPETVEVLQAFAGASPQARAAIRQAIDIILTPF